MPTGIYKRKPTSEETKRKISEANKGHKVSKATREKIRKANKGKFRELSGNWKGDLAGYTPKHIWISRHYGKANHCERCDGKNAKRFEWANISGKHKRDISDYMQLCPSCHRKYDYKEETGRKISRAKKGIQRNHNLTPVSQYDIFGNFIKSFRCVKDVAIELNISGSSIHNQLSGLSKTAGKYIWKKD